MDKIDSIIETLKLAFKTEITKKTTEIEQLKAEVESLRAALKEKDEHCGRLAAILKTQAAEWKRIKDKLANGRRKGDESVSAAGSAGEYCETKEQDTQQAQTEDNNEPESQDDMTQLPTHSHSHNHNQSHNQSIQSTQSPPTEPDSQSHLDLLISLVSSDSSEDETDENKQISRDLEYFQGPKKRKSHSRGCPCCDKYYQVTRSSSKSTTPITANSFAAAPKTPPGFWDTSFTPRQ